MDPLFPGEKKLQKKFQGMDSFPSITEWIVSKFSEWK